MRSILGLIKRLGVPVVLVAIIATLALAQGVPQPSVGLYWTFSGDPTAGAGVCAPQWQLLVRTDVPSIYAHTGTSCTAWTRIGAGTSSGGTVTGSCATANAIAKWTGLSAIACSSSTDDGTTVAIGGQVTVKTATGNTAVPGTLSVLSALTSLVDLAVTPAQSPATLSTTNNDYTPTGWSDSAQWALTGAAGFSTITGMGAISDGHWRVMLNLGSNAITWTNQDASSLAANRLVLPNGISLEMSPGGAAIFRYDTTNSRWYVVVSPAQLNPVLGDVSLNPVGNAPVGPLPAGVTADWDPTGGTNLPATLVIVTPNPMTNGAITAATTSVVDGQVADGAGGTPERGALRVLCQSAINHGEVVFTTSEGSTSAAGNRQYINADDNAIDTALAISHRQCVLQVYNPDVSKWQFVATSDGTLHRFSFSGSFTDGAQGAAVNDYNAGGTEGTNLCSLTRLRLASSSTTSISGLTSCNDGDIKILQFFSTGYTILNNSASSLAGNRFFLPGSTNITPGDQSVYAFMYDASDAGWLLVWSGDQAAGGISGLTTNKIPIATSATSIGDGPLLLSGTTVTAGTDSFAAQMYESPGRLVPTALNSSANNNDYNPTSIHLFQYVAMQTTSGAAATWTGLDAGVDGEEHYFCNYGTGNIILTNNDANSSAGNQFWLNGATSWTMYGSSGQAYSCVHVRYEGQNDKWILIAGSQNDAPTYRGIVTEGGGIQVPGPGTPTQSHGTLGTGSTNFVGNITTIGANTSLTLTFSPAFTNRAWCFTQMNSNSVTEEYIVVTNDKAAPTFSCFNSTTGGAANCDDFSYTCYGQ